jgi:hypothetical protein
MSDPISAWSFTRETFLRRALRLLVAGEVPASRPCFGRSFTRETFIGSYQMPSPDLAPRFLRAVKATTQTNCLPQSTAERHAIPTQKGSDMPT